MTVGEKHFKFLPGRGGKLKQVLVKRPTEVFGKEESLEEYESEFGHHFPTCEKINSAKVCDAVLEGHRGLKMLYCGTRDEGRCRAVSEVKFLPHRAAYIYWYGAEPQMKGHGRHFYEELEKYLRERRCIQRVTLHALSSAESFWENMGFQILDYDDLHGTKDYDQWAYRYPSLNPFEKPLSVKKNCRPRRHIEHLGWETEPEPEEIAWSGGCGGVCPACHSRHIVRSGARSCECQECGTTWRATPTERRQSLLSEWKKVRE